TRSKRDWSSDVCSSDLLPFDLAVDDLDEHAELLVGSIAGAVADAEAPHVVLLSSGGADLSEGTGPITGLHQMEVALRATGTVLKIGRASCRERRKNSRR